jgi:hypothetical protein
MTKRDAVNRKFSTRGLYVNLQRSRVTRNADERRLNLTIRSADCRRMMNSDADIRGCEKAV